MQNNRQCNQREKPARQLLHFLRLHGPGEFLTQQHQQGHTTENKQQYKKQGIHITFHRLQR